MKCEELLAARKLPTVWENDISWTVRRKEIKELLQKEIYGFQPKEPEELYFRELPDEFFYAAFCAGKAPLKKIEISGKLDGKEFSFPMYAVIPAKGKNLPFFVHINFRPDVPDRYMPTEEIVDNGFAIFSFCYEDVTSDDFDFTTGLSHTVFQGEERGEGAPGKIALWAWAASRVMDYCQTLDCLDFSRSAVVGQSRLGKTALFTGMMDERFQFVISNDSGCCGAALSRDKVGENIDKICEAWGFWFTPSFYQYRGKEEQMPFDQHFLLASCAPRHVYVASSVEDTWSDPDSEYLCCVAASEVYEKLGLKGFIHPDRLPQPGDALQEGYIGYHMRSGKHYFSRTDWLYYFKLLKCDLDK